MCHSDDALPSAHRGALETTAAITVNSPTPMPTVLQRADPDRQLGAVLLISDIYGATPFYRGLAARLAESGFTTALPDYLLHQAGALAQVDRDSARARAATIDQQRAMADVSRVGDWLKQECDVERIGIVGFCLGGTFGFDLTAERSDLVVVSFYGFPDGVPWTNPVPAPWSIIDKISGPILGFWGAEDYMDMDSVRNFCDELETRNPEFSSHIFSGAGHGFLGALASDDSVAVQAWAQTLRFLTERLAVPTPVGP